MRKLLYICALLLCGRASAQYVEYLYKNDFTERLINSKDSETSRNSIKMKDGYLYCEQYGENYYWTIAERIFIDPEQDYEIEARMKPYDYSMDAEFGVVFGLKNVNVNNEFIMRPDGFVQIGSRVLDQRISYLNWTYKPELVTSDRWYTFKLVRKSGRQYFYINNMLVYERKQIDMTGRWFGWYTNSQIGLQLDYFYVKQKRGYIKQGGGLNTIRKERLTGGINTDKDETTPMLSADMKTLYFKREFNDKNDFTLDDGDPVLYRCAADTSIKVGAQEKVKMSSGFIAPWYYASVPDGKGFYTGEKKHLQSLSGSGLNYLEESTGMPDYSRSVKFEGGNTITIRHACISADGRVMIMEGFDDYEPQGKDLYVSFKYGSTWSKPQRIPGLNTKGDEITPFITKDMKTLYFSSDGFPGYGFSDVFVCTRLDDSWLSWSAPENMGKPINDAAYNEAFMIPDTGKYAYMASTYGHINNLDIFRIQGIKPPVEPIPIKGKIIYEDGTEHEIAAVEIHFKGKEMNVKVKVEVNKQSGLFGSSMAKDVPFSVRLLDTNYIISEVKDMTTIGKTKERIVEVKVTRIKRGESFVLENIYFSPNKTELLPASAPGLEQLYNALKNNPKLKIEVQGHTSKTNEGEKFNVELSSNRAKAIKSYLVAKGIASSRIQAKGYGYGKPLYTDNSEEHQSLNRRVEVKIIEK